MQTTDFQNKNDKKAQHDKGNLTVDNHTA